MDRVEIRNCRDALKELGRTFFHEQTGVLYINWSCAGVELIFTGTVLLAEMAAHPGVELEGLPWEENLRTHPNYPWFGVLVDDEEEPSRYIEVRQEKETCLIFQSGEVQTHRIRIVKLSENLKAQLGISAFVTDGELSPLPERARAKRIEFVGDSITCGFGNMTGERDRLFYTAEENGWLSHAAIAARMLGMDWSMVCVSGICTSLDSGIPNEYGMDMLYPYTDRIMQDKLGENDCLQRWDFAAHPADCVVINLGTNDATGIVMAEDSKAQYEKFRKAYRSFLETVRACNGKQTHIICALGCLDYYLYQDISQIVGEYRRDTGDTRVRTFRYQKISPLDGWGACTHPSRISQEKMGREIAKEISCIFAEQREGKERQ